MVSANPPARYQLEIFRTGYYGGRGARLMTTLGPFRAETQPDPAVGAGRSRSGAEPGIFHRGAARQVALRSMGYPLNKFPIIPGSFKQRRGRF
jgi:hypothetical protein